MMYESSRFYNNQNNRITPLIMIIITYQDYMPDAVICKDLESAFLH